MVASEAAWRSLFASERVCRRIAAAAYWRRMRIRRSSRAPRTRAARTRIDTARQPLQPRAQHAPTTLPLPPSPSPPPQPLPLAYYNTSGTHPLSMTYQYFSENSIHF
ncbi:hypothetical protein O0L34_g2958 [Tuta absoluta]|nr:hypothetical protein O0L34_g2958 [Tuta absoluta]